MHDHDIEADAAGPAAARPHDDHEALSGQDIGKGVEAGRPDALGPGGLLHLQQAAGNAGVTHMVAQRRARDDGERSDDEPSPVHDVVASKRSPLDPDTRTEMEAAVGHDFGDVEVHTDGRAAGSARAVQAHAYTVGNHVVFGEGRYRPETPEGRHTLAHELTHVVQQRQGPVDGTPAGGGIALSHPGDRFEREAESVARNVSSGSATAPAGPEAPAPGPAPTEVQRQEAPATDGTPVQRQDAEQDEEEEEMPVSKLDQGVDVQRQADTEEEEGDEDESVTAG
jgi:hypothetical protein